jgi:AraC-like DNA-binding protein
MPFSLRVVTAGYTFQMLRVGATLWDGRRFWPIHLLHSPHAFELEHGREVERGPYNTHCLEQVFRTKKIVHGRHAGLSDLFVPVLWGAAVGAVLVTGPFSTSRPTAADVLSRWRWLTARQGHLADPEFANFLSMTLATLVLGSVELATFERMLVRLACLMAGRGNGPALEREIEALRGKLLAARFVDRMWETAQSMVDDRTARSWASPNYASSLRELGLSRVPDAALVGIALGREPRGDPVDEAVRRDAFQRSSVELARSMGAVIAGRVGDGGVMFLCAFKGSRADRRHKMQHLEDRVAQLGRRQFGLSLHFGWGASTAPLSRCYQEAVGAAEAAVTRSVRSVEAESNGSGPPLGFRRLRQDLLAAVETSTVAFPARFDGYLEAVAVRAGHRPDLARAHLDAAFESVAGMLMRTGALDGKSYALMGEGLDRAADEARTLADLFAAYRRAAKDLADTVARPVPARRERSLRRAVEHIERHYAEPMRAPRVAAIAGFAPKYFSRLFKEREGLTFEAYVGRVRIERAKELLTRTELTLARVAELTGFRSASYFCHVFRKAVGRTPADFRSVPRRNQQRTKLISSERRRRSH